MHSLHVFRPRIARTLNEFCVGWNNHIIRTAGNKYPRQHFPQCAIELRCSGQTALDFFEIVNNSYGVDEEGMAADKNDYDHVVIPECIFFHLEKSICHNCRQK